MRLTVLLLAWALGGCAAPPTGQEALEYAAENAALDVLRRPAAGVAVGVARDGEVIYESTWGLASAEDSVPLTPAHPHQIASLTKQFTAAAVLRLVDQGRMALDDPIQRYLPAFETDGHTVTIHHLLNHTSGIPSYTGVFGMDAVPEAVLVDSIQQLPFDFPPGEGYSYNNSGYYLLGLVLEAATGMPYEEHMQAALFGPLGLTSTRYCGHGAPVPVGHAEGQGGLVPEVLPDMSYPGAAGGLCSTVGDLLRWQHALATGQVVSPASYARMTTPAAVPGVDDMIYGYGLSTGSVRGHPVIRHGGGIPGFNTFLAYYPEERLGIAVLVNTSQGGAQLMEEAIARALLEGAVEASAVGERGVGG